MVRPLLAFVDFFLVRNTSVGDRRVRARMFAFLLLFSTVVVGLPFFTYVFSGKTEPRHFLVLLPIIIMQLALLGILRYLKDHEWLCVLMMLVLDILWAFDVAHQQASFLAQGIRIFPLMLVIGLFCVTDPSKRLFVIGGVAAAIGAIFIRLHDVPIAQLLAIDDPSIHWMLVRSSYSISLITLIYVYWYVYLKKRAMQDFEKETQLRTQSARLGEVTGTLRGLVPEFHRPLQMLEKDLGLIMSERNLPDATELKQMGSQIERMTEVTQSVAWIYRAYRGEQVGRTQSQHFAEHLLLLIRGKLQRNGWTAQLDGLATTAYLSGPLPTVMVLILSLVEHVVEGSEGNPSKLLHIEIYCEDAFSCRFAWNHHGRIPSLATRSDGDLQRTFSEENLRLELIAELMEECGAKLAISSDEVMSLISVSGSWLASKDPPAMQPGLLERRPSQVELT